MVKQNLFLMVLNLQLFAEGGDGGTVSAGATGATGTAAVSQTSITDADGTTATPIDRKAEFEKRDMAVYTKKIFGMFDGEEQRVKIQFENNLAGVVIDRFGKEVNILPVDHSHFEINVNVAVSNQFFGWLISLGPGAKIVGPESVVEQMKEIVKNLTELYLNKEREL